TETVSVDGVRLRIARLDGPAPTCFVLLHGYPDTLHVFEPLARELARAGPVLAFDWPGQGQSAPAPSCDSPDGRAAFLLRVIEVLAAGRRAVVVAHDMGVLPALALSTRPRSPLAGVVAMNALLVPDAPVSPEIRLLRVGRAYRLALRLGWRAALARCFATFVPEPRVLPDVLRDDVRVAFARREVRTQTIRACERYDDALPAWRTFAAGARVPILLLWGEAERHFPGAHARRFAAACPRATVDVVEGGHHWMAWHAAPIVAARILGWWRPSVSP
ncbi:MAG TPA: alpha/beta fold hydrolase, partial [Kofleriaceae bacterium]|nr:alpha/beta fold hydrolase [Kofleriaceae bacterium]